MIKSGQNLFLNILVNIIINSDSEYAVMGEDVTITIKEKNKLMR